MLHYNYVIFDNSDAKLKKNQDAYYSICMRDLNNQENVHIVSNPLDYAPFFIKWMYSIHHMRRLNRIIKLPFKNVWFPFYFKMKFSNSNPICFVILNRRIPHLYLKYLKDTYSNSRIVLLHRDLLKVARYWAPELVNNSLLDLEYTIDYNEALANGMIYFSEFESKIEIPKDKSYPLCDVFFAGKAKDRLEKILNAYEILSDNGIKCFFYITGVSENKRKYVPGITYSDKQMLYKQMLYYTVNSKCVLEINQSDAVGYTSRFLEAVMYNKKLITDNLFVKSNKFYNPNYIHCIENTKAINPSFVNEDVGVIDYKYNGEFSPLHLIQQIDSDLISRYGG